MIRDITWQAVSFALDGLSARQRETANNIANSDTPGFQSQHVSFEASLQRALDSGATQPIAMAVTDAGHMSTGGSSAQPTISLTQSEGAVRNDGNNVDVDYEMANLAETALRYQTVTQLAGMKVGLLKNIIREHI